MNQKSKDFLNSEQLIENIKSKGISIINEDNTKNILKKNNYYYITGYKGLFKNLDGSYKNGVYFEDIYELYKFDKKIKLIFSEVLFEIEQSVKTVFCNNFCERFGHKDIDLVNPNNYDNTNPHLLPVINKLNNQMSWYGVNNHAVAYYANNYSFIPIWVLVKVLTFGMIRDLIMVQKSNAKDHVCKMIVNDSTLKVNEVQTMLELLITFRNICCHDDKLIDYIHNKVNIMDTPYHSNFNLKKDNNGNYITGKKDMFAAIISIKYFVDASTFAVFITNLSKAINDYLEVSNGISREELLNYMNLPENFIDIINM